MKTRLFWLLFVCGFSQAMSVPAAQVWRQSLAGEWGMDVQNQVQCALPMLKILDGGDFSHTANCSRAVAVLDANRDGYPDLVVGNRDEPSLLYTNNGRGLLFKAEAGDFDNDAMSTFDVIAFDSDGDGDQDIAIANLGQANALFRNDGSNRFTRIDAGDFDDNDSYMGGVNLVAFDADRDGDLDLAVANHQQPCEFYRNDGGNHFTKVDAGDFDDQGGDEPEIAVLDSDGDGDLDILLGCHGRGVLLFRNDGNCRFSYIDSGQLDDAGRNVTSLAALDANADGKTDIVVGVESQANALFLRTGSNLFTQAEAGDLDNTVEYAYALAALDVNRDGFMDIAVGNCSIPNELYLNDGKGRFHKVNAGFFGERAVDTSGLAVLDANMDGVPDIATANVWHPNDLYMGVMEESAVVLAPVGQPGYQARDAGQLDDVTAETLTVLPIDVERDGRRELLVGYYNQPKALYRLSNSFVKVDAGDFDNTASDTRAFATFDMEWDNDDDIAVANFGQPNELYRNDGSNRFTKVEAGDFDDLAYPSVAIVAADVNGDQVADLVVGNNGAPNLIYTNNAHGVFTRINAGDFGASNLTTRALCVFDGDGDGDNDIAVANNFMANEFYRNDGSNHFTRVESGDFDDIGGAVQASSMVAFDIDGDRDTDLIVGNYTEPVEVYRNDGSNQFHRIDAGDLDDYPHHTAKMLAYDANGDGITDVLLVCYGTPSYLFLGRGDGRFSLAEAGELSSFSGETCDGAALDVDADGDEDVVLAEALTTNRLFCWGVNLAETGTVTSIPATPRQIFTNYGGLVRWNKLYVYQKVPTNTDITFDVLNPNNGTPFSGFSGLRPNSNGWISLGSLSPASATSIQVRAMLRQLDGGSGNDWNDTTPSLYRWAATFDMTNGKSFFWSWGRDIRDRTDTQFMIRANALAGWFSPEGYMLGLNRTHYRHRCSFSDIDLRIWALLQSNDTKKAQFWQTYYTNFVKQSDLATMRSWGFNAIRLPFNYRMLTAYDKPGVYDTNGFARLDMAIQWCKSNNLYVILDMHCAPGGQSHDPPVDSEWTYWEQDAGTWWEHGVPVLWTYDGGYYSNTLQKLGVGRTPEFNKKRTVDLWREIAKRYKNEDWIIGYELMNEPYLPWGVHSGDLRDLMIRITSAVREVDRNHLIFTEGNFYASTFEGIVPPWDNNTVLVFHKYWRPTVYDEIDEYISGAAEYNLPLFNSEAGENSNPWHFEFKQLLESNNVSWCWWGDKKVDSIVAAYAAPITTNYQYVIDNFRDLPVDTNRIWQGLMDVASNIASARCRFDPGYYGAILDTNFNRVSKPYSNQVIPGPIRCANYDIGNQGVAYWDYTVKNESNWNGPPWNTGWGYRNDGVDLAGCGDTHAWSTRFNVFDTRSNEWLRYTVAIQTSGFYDVTFRAANSNATGALTLTMGTNSFGTVAVPANGFAWTTYAWPGSYFLRSGTNRLEVRIANGNYSLSWVALTLHELLQNGALTGSGNVPNFWQNWNDYYHDPQTAVYRSGPNAWKFGGFFPRRPDYLNCGIYQDMSCIPSGTVLRVGGWLYTPSTAPLINTSRGSIVMEFYNSSGALISQPEIGRIDSASARNTWINREGLVTVPGGTVTCRILARWDSWNYDAGEFYADDLYIGFP